jgi:hypothetical protein
MDSQRRQLFIRSPLFRQSDPPWRGPSVSALVLHWLIEVAHS